MPESAWFKSSYSGGDGGECVEVAVAFGAVHIRDTKGVDGPLLTTTPEAWSRLLALATSS
ncbi:DUF397 domain-containing protein [Streptomyces aidingensis]|uniref:DUF397 domain-containing protein n=1 Tax=Streptomyces aidingensis TaxID=910347 RepID=UPI003CCC3E17